MGGIPFAPPVLYGHRPNSSIRDLILMSGQERARAAQNSGAIWANALGNIGQTIGGAITERGAQKRKEGILKKNEEAMFGAIQGYDPADPEGPKKLLANLSKIQGPEKGVKTAEAVLAFHKQTQDKPAEELDGMARGLAWLAEQPDAVASVAWPVLRQRYAASAAKAGIPDPGETWDPSFRERIKPVAGLLGAVSGKLSEAKPIVVGAESRLVGPDGKIIVDAVPKAPADAKPLVLGEGEIAYGPDGKVLARGNPKQHTEKEQSDYTIDNVRFSGKTNQPVATVPKALGATETTASRSRSESARNALTAGEQLLKKLNDPKVAAVVGSGAGSLQLILDKIGQTNPEFKKLRADLDSFAALQPSVHGFRAVAFANKVEAALSASQNIESLKGAIQGYLDTARVVAGAKPEQLLGEGVPSQAPQVTDEASYAALPEGAVYTTPDGRRKIKGKR